MCLNMWPCGGLDSGLMALGLGPKTKMVIYTWQDIKNKIMKKKLSANEVGRSFVARQC